VGQGCFNECFGEREVHQNATEAIGMIVNKITAYFALHTVQVENLKTEYRFGGWCQWRVEGRTDSRNAAAEASARV